MRMAPVHQSLAASEAGARTRSCGGAKAQAGIARRVLRPGSHKAILAATAGHWAGGWRAHCQTVITRQPLPMSNWALRSSRATFAANFSYQKVLRVDGTVERRQPWACQKQP